MIKQYQANNSAQYGNRDSTKTKYFSEMWIMRKIVLLKSTKFKNRYCLRIEKLEVIAPKANKPINIHKFEQYLLFSKLKL